MRRAGRRTGNGVERRLLIRRRRAHRLLRAVAVQICVEHCEEFKTVPEKFGTVGSARKKAVGESWGGEEGEGGGPSTWEGRLQGFEMDAPTPIPSNVSCCVYRGSIGEGYDAGRVRKAQVRRERGADAQGRPAA